MEKKDKPLRELGDKGRRKRPFEFAGGGECIADLYCGLLAAGEVVEAVGEGEVETGRRW